MRTASSERGGVTMTGGAGTTEILLGHRVGRPAVPDALGPDAALTVAAAELDRLLEARRVRQPVAAHELAESRDEARLVLTFDDGYRDNLTEALPVLERHGVPAVVFVTTGFVGGTSYPVELRLAAILSTLAALRLPDGHELPCATADEKRAAYERLRAELKRAGAAGREREIERLAALNGVEIPAPDDRFLDWDAVRQLDRHPLITIGAHTRTHPLLTHTPGDEAWDEIAGGKAELEEQLGHPVDLFAYPYGGHDFRVRRMVARAGFVLAFTTGPGLLRGRAGWRRLRIPRTDLRQALARIAA